MKKKEKKKKKKTVLLSIQAFLSAPNPDDPLANDVAEMWKVNEVEAIRNAKDWTQVYAVGNRKWTLKRRKKQESLSHKKYTFNIKTKSLLYASKLPCFS